MHPFLRHLNYCLQFILPVCFPLSPFSRFSLSTRLSSSLTSISLLLLFRCLGVSPGTSPLPPVSGCAPPRTLVSSFPRAVGSLCSPSRRRLPLSSPPSPPPPGASRPPLPAEHPPCHPWAAWQITSRAAELWRTRQSFSIWSNPQMFVFLPPPLPHLPLLGVRWKPCSWQPSPRAPCRSPTSKFSAEWEVA